VDFVKTKSSLVDGIEEQFTGNVADVATTQPVMMTGMVVDVSASGVATVRIGRGHLARDLQSRSCVTFGPTDVGKKVVLTFDNERPRVPIVLGALIGEEDLDVPSTFTSDSATKNVELDGTTVELGAEESLTLRCGKARITLTRDGKIVIRGMHVVTHADGVNRIKGGSVELN
jgi:hypothetical protein